MNTIADDFLSGFLRRYLPLFYREEQRMLARVVIQGKLSNLRRKTLEPIAQAAECERKPVQHFVGAGKWNDEALMAELRRHVVAEMSDPEGVLIVQPRAFPKKGSASCGVARQRCVEPSPERSKIDNCQVGIFLGYGAARGHGLLDRRLYLPTEWTEAAERRHKNRIPAETLFQFPWQIALELIARCADVPHAWIAAGPEFGAVAEFRRALDAQQQNYVLEVPGHLRVSGPARAGETAAPFEAIEDWVSRQPSEHWQSVEREPAEPRFPAMQILQRRVHVESRADQPVAGQADPTETLLVVRTLEPKQATTYYLSNAQENTPGALLARVGGVRSSIEHLLQQSDQDVGLGHYEVRSWVGWHHHMTLSLLALWFLTLQRWRSAPVPSAEVPSAEVPARTPLPPFLLPERRGDHLHLDPLAEGEPVNPAHHY